MPSDQTRPRRHLLGAQLATPLRRFVTTEAGSAGLLLAATVIALLWANSPWSDSYESLWHTTAMIGVGDHVLALDLEHWVNDALMALFFFVIGLEVRRELSIGELTRPPPRDRPRRRRAVRDRAPRAAVPGRQPERRGGPRVGRRDRDRHRVPARRAGDRRPALPDPAARLPAHPDRVRRHRRGEHHRDRLLGVVRRRGVGRRRGGAARARGAEPARRVARCRRSWWSRLVLWVATIESGLHPVDRGHDRGPGHRLARAAAPRRRRRRLPGPRVPPVAAARGRPDGHARPAARGLGRRAAAARAAPVDELRRRARLRAGQRRGRPARRRARRRAQLTADLGHRARPGRRKAARDRPRRPARRCGSASASCRAASGAGRSSAARRCRASASPSRC